MKKNSIKNILAAMAALLLIVAFSGCDIVDSGASFDGADRKVSETQTQDNKPLDFTAYAILYQLDDGDMLLQGAAGHAKTIGEHLEGYVYYSPDWLELNGAPVVMDNFTNYFVDMTTADLEGNNHSDITILNPAGEELMAINANGSIAGNFYDGAELDLKWNAVGPGANSNGTINGNFFWGTSEYLYYVLTTYYGVPGEILAPGLDESSPYYQLPFGLFTITTD